MKAAHLLFCKKLRGLIPKNIEKNSWMEQTSTSAWSETEAWHYAKGQDSMQTYNGDEITIRK